MVKRSNRSRPQRPRRRAGNHSPRARLKRRGAARASRQSIGRKPRLQFEWAKAISSDQWENYRDAIHALQQARIRFLLGGGFAGAIYTGRWRNTKDIDFYIRHEDREAAVKALAGAGFADYFSILPYDRKWIYRSTRDGVIVDIIWAMANQRAQVDEHWFKAATEVSMRGERIQVVPIEEFLWCKLYILQRDHCDWTDIFNLLFAAGEQINWKHLLRRVDEDHPLLHGLLSVYGWLCPRRAIRLPRELRRDLKLPNPETKKRSRRNRIRLLDTRDWFAALARRDRPLEV